MLVAFAGRSGVRGDRRASDGTRVCDDTIDEESDLLGGLQLHRCYGPARDDFAADEELSDEGIGLDRDRAPLQRKTSLPGLRATEPSTNRRADS